MKGHWTKGPRGDHRKCYQEYTHSGKLKRSTQPANEPKPTSAFSKKDTAFSTTESPPKRMSRSQVQSFNVKNCIICQKGKVKKNKGKARTRERLTQNTSEHGRASLLKAARIRCDERVLLQIEGQDTIALEIKYHRSCYKDYVRQETLSKLEDQNCQNEDFTTTNYQRACEFLSDYVQSEIIPSAKVISMSELQERFIKHLNESGVEVTSYRSSKL